MKSFTFILNVVIKIAVLISVFISLSCSSTHNLALNPTSELHQAPSLAILASKRGLSFGTAVREQALEKDEAYRKLILKEFNSITPENSLKFSSVRPSRNDYDYTQLIKILCFARDNNLAFRGHTFSWFKFQPEWIKDLSLTELDLRFILKDYISKTVVLVKEYLPEQTITWDVVNEALNSKGEFRENNPWLKIGHKPEDHIAFAFRLARANDPTGKFFYNDFDIEIEGPKLEALIKLIKKLKAQGVKVDGVGMQMHLSEKKHYAAAEIIKAMRKLEKLGLEVNVTELDYRLDLKNGVSEAMLAKQAQGFKNALLACLAVKACKAFSFWGVTDKYSWIPEILPGFGSALMFDEEFKEKAGYWGVQKGLEGLGNM